VVGVGSDDALRRGPTSLFRQADNTRVPQMAPTAEFFRTYDDSMYDKGLRCVVPVSVGVSRDESDGRTARCG
jgi:hypothetical protein